MWPSSALQSQSDIVSVLLCNIFNGVPYEQMVWEIAGRHIANMYHAKIKKGVG